jgi:hypothetical protein
LKPAPRPADAQAGHRPCLSFSTEKADLPVAARAVIASAPSRETFGIFIDAICYYSSIS